jgi:hypothetical protein
MFWSHSDNLITRVKEGKLKQAQRIILNFVDENILVDLLL